ncbi:MAG: M50 family metallopeptidase [Gemmatimonadota bacterium]|nr:MAG: M50 family metallopeptidase [Gemmatimonadota bacterium]
MEEITKRRLKFLAGFAVYFVALWFLWNTAIVYPLKIFVVLLHEISHGMMSLATGGTIERIIIRANEGGLCQCSGGSPFLVLSAGYLGSLLWGAAILWAARGRGSIPRIASAVIGVLVIGVTLLFVRNWFGILFGVAFGGVLITASRQLPAEGNAALLTALGLTSCLYAVLDIKSDVLDRPEVMSDARMLADLTGVPTLIWGLLWIVLALLVSAWLFRRAFESVSSADVRKEVFEV